MLSLSIGASIALPLISFINFVGGSFGSIFIPEELEVTWVGEMPVDDMLVMTGDDDLLNFVSLLVVD